VGGQARRVRLVVAHDAMEVAVLALQDLEQPMRHLDVRIAAQLAEHGRGLDGLVPERIQLPEQSRPADLRHDCLPPLCPLILVRWSIAPVARPPAPRPAKPLRRRALPAAPAPPSAAASGLACSNSPRRP